MPPPYPGLAEARSAFDRVAAGTLSGVDPGVRDIALACGYTAEDLASVPAAAVMGLGCGNPLAVADVRPGETVVDLGCGGGLDVLLAAERGAGRAIGFDVSPAMIERANLNRRGSAEFHAAGMEAIPLPDASVDCVLSNGAFRYAVRTKKAALQEMFRVLKPGGRLSLCDLAWKRMPINEHWDAPGPAVTGLEWMLFVSDLEAILPDRGFVDVRVTPTAFDLRSYARPVRSREAISDAARLARWEEASLGCCGIDAEPASAFHEGFATILQHHDLAAYVTAVTIKATKPAEGTLA